MNTRLWERLGLLQSNPTESSAYIYTAEQNDDMDFDRLFDGKDDCYRLPAQAIEHKKKHIIITDPSIAYGLENEGSTAIELWAKLFLQGFTISVWTANGLMRVNNLIDLLPALNRIEPIHHADLQKRLGEFKLASKDCYLARIGHTKLLMKELHIIESKENEDVLSINFAEIYKLPYEKMKKLLSCIPDEPLIYSEFTASKNFNLIKNKSIDEFFKRHPAILLRKNNYAIKDFKQNKAIKKLFITQDFSNNKTNWLEIDALIRSFPALEEFGIATDMFFDKRPQDAPTEKVSRLPSTLKSLILGLDNRTINWNFLLDILKDAALEKLTLNSYKFDCTDNIGPFPSSLKELRIKGVKTSWQHLASALAPCTKLEKLSLVIWGGLDDMPQDFHLPSSLKSLELETVSCEKFHNLDDLLRRCATLEALTLKLDTDKIKYFMSDDAPPPKLSKLVSLNIQGRINIDQLNKFIVNMPNLKKLVISKIFSLDSKENYSKITLPPSLQEISFYSSEYSDITWQEISDLFNANNNAIEILNLKRCNINGKLPQDLSFLRNVKFLNMIEAGNTNVGYPIENDIARIKEANPSLVINYVAEEEKNVNKHALQSGTVPRLDNLTQDTNTTLRCKQVFKDVHPSLYRNKIYDGVKVSQQSILLKEVKTATELTELIKLTAGAETHIGNIELKENEWIQLTSLTADDKLIAIETNPNVKLAIKYCKETGIYYVKPEHEEFLSEPLIISYTIEAELEKRKFKLEKIDQAHVDLIQKLEFDQNGKLIPNAALNNFKRLTKKQQLQALVAFFNEFTPKTIPAYEGFDLLNEIIYTQAGACRHRAIALLALANALDLPVRTIFNDIHAFAEIIIDGLYYQAQLGGAPAELIIEPAPALIHEDIKLKEIAEKLLPSNRFRTWDKNKIDAESMSEYVEKLLHQAEALTEGRKNALSVLHKDQIPAFYTEILKQKKAACFFLPNLNSIKEKQNVINDAGRIDETDSALKKFLEQAKPNDVLLVDWSEYEAMHVGHNSMINPDRKIRGMTIPKGVVVMVMLDSDQMMSDDFYSRFRKVSECPQNLTISSFLPRAEDKPSNTTPEEIRFYDDAWRSTLLGNVVTDKTGYRLTTSRLLEAIQSGAQSIVLRNAPWELPEFKIFMTELLTKRQFTINGKTYPVPEQINFIRDDNPYLLNEALCTIEPYTRESELNNAFTLNMMTLAPLFQCHQSTPTNELKILDGLIKQHSNETLTLLVTDSLPHTQWAKLLTEAEKYNTKLKLIVPAGVQLPFTTLVQPTELIADARLRSQNTVIVTNDIEAQMAELVSGRDGSNIAVFRINEKTTLANLLGHITIEKKDGKLNSDFQLGDFVHALQTTFNVILKGNISSTLAKQLFSMFQTPPYLMVNGERVDTLPSQLIVITDHFPDMPLIPTTQLQMNEEAIWSLLEKTANTDQLYFLKKLCHGFYSTEIFGQERFNYTQLKSMLDHLNHSPHINPLKSMLNARADYPQLKPIIKGVWEYYSGITKQKDTQPVLQKRVNKLAHYLKNNWYVFVAGSSGVGKSTTIQQAIHELDYVPVTVSGSLKDKLKEWIKPGVKRALFIDEVNLFAPGELDILEGLYDDPPRILLDGKLCDVPTDNRLLFAGNFGHFEGRQQSRFISQHGNIITFKEFNNDFLQKNIMQPVCNSLNIPDAEALAIQQIFIKLYHLVNSNFSEKHPLTPRNLQMMVMRFAKNNNPYLAAYDEISGVLNKEHRAYVANWMKEEFNIDVKQAKHQEKQQTDAMDAATSMKLAKTRINPVRIIDNLMSIRDKKILHAELSSTGSNGLILEGNSGIGKSYLADEYLHANDYVDGNLVSREDALEPHKRYYHIHAGDLEQVKKQLIKAFHEGAIVIIDEMNTMLLEHTLNALLSGVTPEGQPADNPGFFVIGTQNPAHFGKRSVLSDALLNRFQKLDLKDYKREDLLAIIQLILQDPNGTEKLVDELLIAQQYARLHHKHPEPTPRDGIEEAKTIKSKS